MPVCVSNVFALDEIEAGAELTYPYNSLVDFGKKNSAELLPGLSSQMESSYKAYVDRVDALRTGSRIFQRKLEEVTRQCVSMNTAVLANQFYLHAGLRVYMKDGVPDVRMTPALEKKWDEECCCDFANLRDKLGLTQSTEVTHRF